MGQEEDTTASHWISKNKKEKRAHAMPFKKLTQVD